MLDLGYHLGTENWIIYYDERHPLLLKCFITILRCIKRWEDLLITFTSPLLSMLVPFPPRSALKMHPKMIDLGYPSNKGNRILCYEERHTLLLNWLINLPGIQKRGETNFWYHSQAPYCSHNAISANVDSQIAYTILQDLGYLISPGNGMLYWEKRHPLLLKWFITFLGYIRKVGIASGSIIEPLIVHTMPFLSR